MAVYHAKTDQRIPGARMAVYHAKTDPDLLTRLRQMLGSSARADIAVGYFFMSGFAEVMDALSQLNKTRILVGRADRPTLEAVAAGLRQADALRAQLDAEQTVSRRQRQEAAAGTVSEIARGVAAMPQTDANQDAVERLRQLVSSGLLEVRAYPAGSSTPKPTSAGTTTTPSRGPPWSAPPTSAWPASPATPN